MTVLDEFIVKLKLDPKGFDQAQRAAFDKLRGFERQTQQSTEHVAEAMRKGMGAFYTQFSASLDKSGKGLSHLGDQTRRTGDQIYAGGATGAAGFKHLTSSLLEAYAVVGTLEGAMHKLEEGAQRATSTVIGSLTTGIKPRELGALAGMFPQVPYEQAVGAFQKMKSWEAMWQAGQPPQQVVEALARFGGLAGVQVDMRKLGSVRDMLMQISQIERRLPVGLRAPFLQQLGLPLQMLPELLKRPQELMRDYNEAMRRMPTAGVTEELFNLDVQVKKTGQSWLTLWETIEAAASKAGVMTALKDLDAGLQEANTWFTTTREGAEALKIGLQALSVVIGVSLVGGIAKLISYLAKLSGFGTVLGTLAKLPPWMWGIVAGGYAFKPSPTNKGESENLRRMGPPIPGWQWYPRANEGSGGWGPPGLPGAEVPGQGTPSAAPRNNPGNIRPPNQTTGFMSYPDEDTGVRAISTNLLAYQDRHGINTLRGVITRWSPPGENDTPALIERAAKRTGYDPDQPLDLHDPVVRAKVTRAIILQEQGDRLPAGVTDESITAAVGASPAPANPDPDTSTIPGMRLTPTPKTGLGSPATAEEQPESPSIGSTIQGAWQGLVKKAQAAGIVRSDTPPPATAPTQPGAPAVPQTPPPAAAGPSPPTFQRGGIVRIDAHEGESVLPAELTTFLLASARIAVTPQMARGGGDTSISIGQIAVHTAATDARGIAASIRQAVARELTQRRTTQVMQFNTIYE